MVNNSSKAVSMDCRFTCENSVDGLLRRLTSRASWLDSKAYKTYKPKRIVPVPTQGAVNPQDTSADANEVRDVGAAA